MFKPRFRQIMRSVSFFQPLYIKMKNYYLFINDENNFFINKCR